MRRFAVLGLFLITEAQGGMTVITLSDAAKARLDVLSFFVVAYLLLAWAVKGLWNSLAKSFERMPKLNYRRALSLLLLSGLFLYVILTMISGAREILTPGAWEKQGIGYRLRDEAPGGESKELRKMRLNQLKEALWNHAALNDGVSPVGPFSGEIPRSLWQLADRNYYGYIKPDTIGAGREILAYEPSSAGPRRYILFNDGSIEDWSEGQLNSALRVRWEK